MLNKEQINVLNRLEQQKKDLDKELSLEQTQAQLTKNYVMKQGAYKVIITIYELNDLQPKSPKILSFQVDEKTACDAFVQIKVGNQSKITEIKKQTNNPIFDEQFYFQFPKVSVEELDRLKIQFNVYDTKFWGKSHSLVGSFQLDWTNVYFKRNHQIYRAWLTLYDPQAQIDRPPAGYLLANIAVLGQNDQITIHDSAFIKDPLVTIQDTITSSKLISLYCSISIQIYRAENLIPIDSFRGQTKAYVIAKFSGNKVKSSTVTNINPQWNQNLKLGTQVPNKSKYITLQVRNKNYLTNDDIIGVLKIPFVDLFMENQPKPQWGHLYGPPMAGKDVEPYNYATKMQVYGDKIGSHYRGRLFFKITGKKDVFTKNIKNKLVFKFPYRVMPVIPMKLFILRIDIIEGFGLPAIKQCYIQICIGEYTIKSRKFVLNGGFCQFYQMLEDKSINLAENVQSMPDLVIYFCDGLNEQNRLAFVRIKAGQILNNNQHFDEVKVRQLKIDKSVNSKVTKYSAGFIACKVHLFNSNSSSSARKKIPQSMKIKQQYVLKVFLYRGQDFPPANKSGDCDPMINFSFDKSNFKSKQVRSTYNPLWNQILTETVKIQDLFTTKMQKCLICDVYDYEESDKNNYIGTFSVKINGLMRKRLKLPMQNYPNKLVQFIYSKPKWHHVVNPNIDVGNQLFGRVLISCCLFRKSYELQNKQIITIKDLQKFPLFKQITTKCEKKNINFFIIGIRDLKITGDEDFFQRITARKLKQVFIKPEIKINCLQSEPNISDQGVDFFKLKSNSCEINKIYRFKDVRIPKNKFLSTYVDFRIRDAQKDYIFGTNSINLKTLKNTFQDQNDFQGLHDDKVAILDVQDLQTRLKKLNMLNKINQSIKNEQQNAKFILAKRLKNSQDDKLIAPVQIQQRFMDQDDPQACIQMQKLIIEFQREFQQTKSPDDNLYAYIKYAFPNSSSNNDFQNIGKNKDYNHIDEQQRMFNSKRKRGIQLKVDKEKQYEVCDEQDSLINQDPRAGQSKRKTLLPSAQNNRDLMKRQPQTENFQQSSSKNLVNIFKPKKNQQYSNTLEASIIKNKKSTLQQSLSERQKRQKKQNKKAKQVISDFNLNSSLSLSEKQHNDKIIKYEQVSKGLQLEQQHMQEAIAKQQQYKYVSAVKLSLFKWYKKEPQKQKQTYQDYDTDEQQNLDIIPEWYKNRRILPNDLQHILSSNRTIQNIHIYRGRKIQGLETRVKERVGTVKMVVLSGQDQSQLQTTVKYYEKLLRPKEFSCRVYVLKGKSLLTDNIEKPNTYLRFTYGQKVTQYKNKIVKNQNNPEYYMCHEEWIVLPGPSTIKIQVMQLKYLIGSVGDKLSQDKLIGYTQIDVEDRYFMKKWHLFDKKPIELRNLFSEYGIGTQGRIQTWIDLVDKKKWLVSPVAKIAPPPWDQYQLRVIVWSTKDCVFKNQQLQSNDIFVRGQIGGGNFQETDVHWACRSVGNFNYRFKFSVFYPAKPQYMYSDMFIVQIWDKDVIGFDNLIGEARINLNTMHKIIQKAVARKKTVVASKKIIEKNMRLTDKFWIDVVNHRQKDEFGQIQSQGKVQLSFQLVPMQIAKTQRANGFGRSEPNVYPTLGDPQGRLNFNFLQPLDFLRQLLGPTLYKSLCIKCFCLLIVVIVVLLFVLFGTSIVAGLVARG